MNEPYKIVFTKYAQNDLKCLNRGSALLILKKLKWLAQKITFLSLVPLESKWGDCYCLRVGGYRVIYRYSDEQKLITVEALGHRHHIYDE
jgi:mRNA-degrading endonuclease RelE of RelBE toxin-antitoxin system